MVSEAFSSCGGCSDGRGIISSGLSDTGSAIAGVSGVAGGMTDTLPCGAGGG